MKVWSFSAHHRKMAPLVIILKMSNMSFVWPIFSSFTNIGYLFSLMCVIWAKKNKAVINWNYTDVFFTIKGQLKMILYYFRCFDYFNINMTFVKNFMNRADFQSSSNFCCSTSPFSLLSVRKLRKDGILDFFTLCNMCYWLLNFWKLGLCKLAICGKQAVKSAILSFFS